MVAIVLLQTLYFKFSAHPDSVYIFSAIGMEPVGRIGVGIAELVTAILILIPRTTWLGALLSTGLMVGALGMHLTSLGIEVGDDGGKLFYMAAGVFLMSLVVLIDQRKSIPFIGDRL
jgi:uncharacterized membrane protein YphA (DoxX/SURF4 family)